MLIRRVRPSHVLGLVLVSITSLTLLARWNILASGSGNKDYTYGTTTFNMANASSTVVEQHQETQQTDDATVAGHRHLTKTTRTEVPEQTDKLSLLQNWSNLVLPQRGQEAWKRKEFVARMVTHAWWGYRLLAFGSNDLKPLSAQGYEERLFLAPHSGLSVVDAIDTLYIMNMETEFQDAKDWIMDNFRVVEKDRFVSVYDVNIHLLGGLLSAYALTENEMFKEKATQLAESLLPAFNSPTGFPYKFVNLKTGEAKGKGNSLAGIGSFDLEFNYLSEITGDARYSDCVKKIRDKLQAKRKPGENGLFFNFLNVETGEWKHPKYGSLGIGGDSFYEYLLKEWLRTAKSDQRSKDMFDDFAISLMGRGDESLVKIFPLLVYIDLESSVHGNETTGFMEHTSCSAGGLFALTAMNTDQERDLFKAFVKMINKMQHNKKALT